MLHLVVSTLLLLSVNSQNLIQNGDFEQSSSTILPWSSTFPPKLVSNLNDINIPQIANCGSYSLILCNNLKGYEISQTITLETSQKYTLSFDLLNPFDASGCIQVSYYYSLSDFPTTYETIKTNLSNPFNTISVDFISTQSTINITIGSNTPCAPTIDNIQLYVKSNSVDSIKILSPFAPSSPDTLKVVPLNQLPKEGFYFDFQGFTPALIGFICVGGIVFLVLIASCIYCCVRRSNKKKQEEMIQMIEF